MCDTLQKAINRIMKLNPKELPWSLIIARLSGEISPTDNEKLEIWLADEGHRALFRSISSVWDSVQTEASRIQPDEKRCWEIIARKIGYEEKTVQPPKKTYHIGRGMHRWSLIAACGILLLAIALFVQLKGGWGTEYLPTYTAMDGKTKITLRDSTIVWLRENSTLACMNNFKGKERRVQLTGEAFFEVKSDKEHPFIVETNGLDVKVHGTKFNVMACEDEQNIMVSLEEGSVELIQENREGEFLKPGEIADYNRKTGELEITEGGDHMNSWVSGNLNIQNTSLQDIAQILSHHFNMDIQVKPSIGMKYYYTFQSHGESLKDLLDILTSINPIHYEYQDEHTVLITPNS